MAELSRRFTQELEFISLEVKISPEKSTFQGGLYQQGNPLPIISWIRYRPAVVEIALAILKSRKPT